MKSINPMFEIEIGPFQTFSFSKLERIPQKMIFWLATDFMESEKITEKRLTNFLDDFFYQKVQKFLFLHLKGTLHFNINLGSKASLDPP